MLATIFDRLRSQYTCILELQDQLAKERQARDLLQDKIDFVVKRTEDGNKALTDDVLRKFEQKLLEFTRSAEACGDNSKQVNSLRQPSTLQDCCVRLCCSSCCCCCSPIGRAAASPGTALQALIKRISYVEERLEGAENLGGHCQAVHDMCAILGMSIPQVTVARLR